MQVIAKSFKCRPSRVDREKIIELFKAGRSASQVAKEVGASRYHVTKLGKLAGVYITPEAHQGTASLYVNAAKFLKCGKGPKQVALVFASLCDSADANDGNPADSQIAKCEKRLAVKGLLQVWQESWSRLYADRKRHQSADDPHVSLGFLDRVKNAPSLTHVSLCRFEVGISSNDSNNDLYRRVLPFYREMRAREEDREGESVEILNFMTSRRRSGFVAFEEAV